MNNTSNNIKETTAQRLKKAMEARNLRQIDLVEKTGIPKSALSQYISGKFLPKQNRLSILAEALNVSETWLIGYDVPMERSYIPHDSGSFDYSEVPGLMPLPYTNGRTVPLIGSIACGTPILAAENIEKEIFLPDNVSADFCLRCKGDSMINARIYDGDIVFIHKQPAVDNGDIAAVLIDETADMAESTLKRVYKYDDRIMLNAENPSYPPLVFVGNEMNSIRIIGKAVAFLSGIK